MMRNLLFLFLLVISNFVEAQISFAPSPLTLAVSPGSGDNKYDITFVNSKDTTYTIFWKLFKDNNTWQNGWITYICDLNNCYFNNVDACSPNLPNMFPKGTYKFEFHFKPENITGNTIIGFKLYTDRTFTNEILNTTISLNSSPSSSTKDVNLSSIKVFPNPATDYIQIANGGGVKKIILYNMFGKEIKSFFHYNNAQHEISDLRSGMYIVKLLDDKNKVIKTIKFNKSFDGA